MKISENEYQVLWVEQGKIKFIDQRKLPLSFEVFTAETVNDVAFAIKEMVIRGAPAIGAAAAYGMALGSQDPDASAKILLAARPTAHDLFYAVDYMKEKIKHGDDPHSEAEKYVNDIIDRCRRIGEHGAKLIKNKMNILTHCNAGALATVDYGTALAPFRVAKKQGKTFFVFADETRPRLQGALTAWELQQEEIPYAVIADNAAGHFMKKGEIDLVITGADRIANNGDAANKIGTYEKAVLARENNIPFYIAAPVSTIDFSIKSGDEIVIEERDRKEISEICGQKILGDDVPVRNPAFDVTPHCYITGFITEEGIKKKISGSG